MTIRASDILQKIDVEGSGIERVRDAFYELGDKGREAFDRLTGAANDVSPSIDKVNSSVGDLNSGLDSIVSMAKRVAGALGLAFGIRQLVQFTSNWSDLAGRVRIATEGAEEYNHVMERLQVIARNTYSDLTVTTEGFLRQEVILRQLGYTTDEMLNFTEALNDALVVSGARGQRAESAIYNLSKAMSMNSLQGLNLISVLEQVPKVAELIAEEMGVTVNELRTLGSQGKITADIMHTALTKSMVELREEAELMPITIADGMVLLTNSFGSAVFGMDQATGAGENVGDMLRFLADNIEIVTSAIAAFIPMMVAAFGPKMVAMVAALFGLIARHPFMILITAITGLIVYLVQVRNELGLFGDIFNKVGIIVDLFTGKFVDIANAAFDFFSKLTTGTAEAGPHFNNFGELIIGILDAIINNFDAVFAAVATFAAVIGGAALITAIGTVIGLIGTLTAGIGALNLALLLNPFVLAIAGAVAFGAALAALIYHFTQTEAGIAQLNVAWETIIDIVAKVSAYVVDVWNSVTERLTVIWQQLISEVQTIADQLQIVWDRIANGYDNVVEKIKNGVKSAVDALKTAWQGFSSWFGGSFLGSISNAVNRIIGLFNTIISAARRAIAAIGRVLKGKGKAEGGPVGMAGGGRVWGAGTSTSDSIWARLSRGEYVIKAASVKYYGQELFDLLNRMMLPKFASGGSVSSSVASSSSSLQPLNLTIGSDIFKGLLAPKETADSLIRYARTEQIRSAGNKPGWYK